MALGKIIIAPKPHLPPILTALSVNMVEFSYILSANSGLASLLATAIPQRLSLLIEVGDYMFTEDISEQPTVIFRTSHKLIKYLVMDGDIFIAVSPGLEPIEHDDYWNIISASIDEVNRPSLN